MNTEKNNCCQEKNKKTLTFVFQTVKIPCIIRLRRSLVDSSRRGRRISVSFLIFEF